MSIKILVVDDDPNSMTLMAYALELEGYQVLQAEAGAQAKRLIQEQDPALVLLDVMLPDLSGLEVCRWIRTEMQLDDLPVVMLSAKADQVDQADGLEAGATAYLTKPADPDQVLTLLRQILD